MENLFELMEQYSLTLRRLNGKVTSSYTPIPNRKLKDNEVLIEGIVKSNVTKEEFDRWQEKGYWSNCRFYNGFVIRQMVRETRQYESGWLVKQDKSHGSNQYWDRKNDFFGKTPEEAIKKAVEHIRKEDEEWEQKRKDAGLKS